MELKVQEFISWSAAKDLTDFVKVQNISRENVVTITQNGGNYTLFYYQ